MAAAVKSCTTELRTHLKEAELTEGKAFLCSFVERIEVNGGEATIRRANRRRLFDRVE